MNKRRQRMLAFALVTSMIMTWVCPWISAQNDIITEFKEIKSPNAMAAAISSLTAAEAQDIGIDLTEYDKIAYPQYVAQDIITQGFDSTEEFKYAFEKSVGSMFTEKNIPASYGMCLNTTDNTLGYIWKSGATFANILGFSYGDVMVGFDVPDSKCIIEAELSLPISSRINGEVILDKYSIAEYPDTPVKNTEYEQNGNYNKESEIYCDWKDFFDNKFVNMPEAVSIDVTDAGIYKKSLGDFSSVLADNPENLSFHLHSNNAINVKSEIGGASDAAPSLSVVYDNSIVYHNACTVDIKDGEINVCGRKTVNFEYSKDIDSETWNEDNVEVVNADNGEKIDIALSITGNNARIEFENNLEDETTYIIKVTGIKDSYGNAVHDIYRAFTTAGVYKELIIDTKTELDVGQTYDFNVSGIMESGKPVSIDYSDITANISDSSVISLSDGKITANSYGYVIAEATVENIDDTNISKAVLLSVPAKQNKEDFEVTGENAKHVHGGEKSYVTNGEEKEILDINYSKFIASGWIYDDLQDKTNAAVTIKSEKNVAVAVEAQSYTVWEDGTKKESIERTKGWHQIAFVSDNGVKIYIDGVLISECSSGDFESIAVTGGENELYADDFSVSYVWESAPVYNNFNVSGMKDNGEIELGTTLTANLEYFDADGDVENGSEYGWYVADEINGAYTKLDITELNLAVGKDYIGKYIKFEAVPKNGMASGEKYIKGPCVVVLGEILQRLISDMNDADVDTVKQTIEGYAELLELDVEGDFALISNKSYIYNELAGKSYSSIEDISEAFSAAVDKFLYKKSYSFTRAYSVGVSDSGLAGPVVDILNANGHNFHRFAAYMQSEPITDTQYAKKMMISYAAKGDPAQGVYIYGYKNTELPEVTELGNFIEFDTDLNIVNKKIKGISATAAKFNVDIVNENLSLIEDKPVSIKFNNTGYAQIIMYGDRNPEYHPYLVIAYDKTKMIDDQCTTMPQNGAVNVVHDLDRITFRFSEEIDESTWNSDNVVMYSEKTGEGVGITLSKVDAKTYEAVLTQELSDETTYRITVDNIKDVSGNALENRYVRFTTEAIFKSLELKGQTSYNIGETSTLTVSLTSVSGAVKRMSATEISFKSSDEEVATVENGVITAKHRGTAVITARYNNYDNSVAENKIIVHVYKEAVNEGFENKANSTGTYSYNGLMSYPINASEQILQSEHADLLEAAFYDDGEIASGMVSFSDGTSKISVGIDKTVSQDKYIVKNGENAEVTELSRVKGWHQIVLDNAGSGNAQIFIDGTAVSECSKADYNTISAKGSGLYIDNVNAANIMGEICYVKNVAIRGVHSTGSILTVSYAYTDSDQDAENGTEIKWYYSTKSSGTYTEISGASASKYTVPATFEGYYIKASVTPKNYYDTGLTVESTPFAINSKTGSGGGGSTGGGGSSGNSSSGGMTLPIGYGSEDNKFEEFSDFDDVPKTYWAYDAIAKMRLTGIVKGNEVNEFLPDNNVSRAEFAAMVIRMMGTELVKYSGSFSDVSESDWYADYIETAYENSIISGFGGKFMPDDMITREEMVKIVVDAYKLMHDDFKTVDYNIQFTDNQEISEWALEYIKTAVFYEIVSGMGDGTFVPKGLATRAQAATVIKKLLETE